MEKSAAVFIKQDASLTCIRQPRSCWCWLPFFLFGSLMFDSISFQKLFTKNDTNKSNIVIELEVTKHPVLLLVLFKKEFPQKPTETSQLH